VSAIKVSGDRHLTEEEIEHLSGISLKTSIWRVNEEKASNQILQHKEIKEAEVNRKLPNMVEIDIKEYNRIAYIYDEGNYFPVIENGKILAAIELDSLPDDAPLMMNWNQGDTVEEFIGELMKLPESIIYAISEIHHTPSEVDPYHITLFMNDGFEVSATVRDFSNKMSAYPSIVAQLDPNQKGVINIEVGTFFKPYETVGDEDQHEGER
jgi:cell division protein FtsQ